MNDDDAPLQWIFHFECFHFLRHVFVKEFCGYCIQTGEHILYYVKSPASVALLVDPSHVSTFALQSSRHGFSLSDGDMDLEELYKRVTAKVSRECTIYATCKTVETFFT